MTPEGAAIHNVMLAGIVVEVENSGPLVSYRGSSNCMLTIRVYVIIVMIAFLLFFFGHSFNIFSRFYLVKLMTELGIYHASFGEMYVFPSCFFKKNKNKKLT